MLFEKLLTQNRLSIHARLRTQYLELIRSYIYMDDIRNWNSRDSTKRSVMFCFADRIFKGKSPSLGHMSRPRCALKRLCYKQNLFPLRILSGINSQDVSYKLNGVEISGHSVFI